MGLHLGNAGLFGKVGDLAQRVDARGTRLRRHYTDRGGALQEVPLAHPGAHHFDRRGGQLIFLQQIAVLGGQRRGEVIDVLVQRKKAIGKPQGVHAPQVFLGRAEGRDHQAEGHRFDRRGRRVCS